MAQNHIQGQNPPIFNPCLEAAEILMRNVLALPSQWRSEAAGAHATPYGWTLRKKNITNVEDVKEQAPSITAPGQRKAKTKICLPVLCPDFRIDLWFLLIVRNIWNRRSLPWSLLTKWCLSVSGNCICYDIYSIRYAERVEISGLPRAAYSNLLLSPRVPLNINIDIGSV